jgi:hypothetical protein
MIVQYAAFFTPVAGGVSFSVNIFSDINSVLSPRRAVSKRQNRVILCFTIYVRNGNIKLFKRRVHLPPPSKPVLRQASRLYHQYPSFWQYISFCVIFQVF